MKVYYIANSRLPTIKAYGLQIVKTCEAMTRIGLECELIVPKRHRYPNTGEGGILEYYKIKTPFKVTELNSLDLIDINLGPFLNKFLFWIQQLYFSLVLKRYLNDKEGIVYSRDQFALSILDSKAHKLFWEAHNFPKNVESRFYKKVLDKIKGLVVISGGLKNEFARSYKGDITVVPDAVDLDEFSPPISKKEARNKLNLPQDKKIVIYSGHLYAWKGVDLLLQVAKNIATFKYLNIEILFVGGTDIDVRRLRKNAKEMKLSNVMILGNRPYEEIPLYLKASDCAVLTGKKSESISEKYTSPLKLFEYMASGCPIVAQDLPSFREILNDNNALIVEPENAEALAEGINKIFTDESLAQRISAQALNDVQEYTWQKRVEKIKSALWQSQ